MEPIEVTKMSNLADSPILNVVTKENKFVLIVNNQGQHVLTRQSDLETSRMANEEGTIESKTFDDSWQENLQSVEESITGDGCREKGTIEENNDFFSMVMSPLEHELASPSAELEHLTLSSPRKSDREESRRRFDGAAEIYSSCDRPTLQTINEESLQQLLYGIDRKD